MGTVGLKVANRVCHAHICIVGLPITCLGARKQKIACVHAPQLVFLKNVVPPAAENVFHKKRHHNTILNLHAIFSLVLETHKGLGHA